MAPCDWEVDPAALDVCPGWAEFPAPVQAAALELATLYLWARTGRQYGPCPLTVRPAQNHGDDPSYRAYPVWPGQDSAVSGPYLFAGVWRNCGCGSGCCCRPRCAVALRGPVYSVSEITVGEDVIPPESYRVDVTEGTYWLVRLDGVCWPTCQDFQANPDEAGSFVVSYEIGREVPEALLVAAAILACEYATGMTGGVCRLPGRMTSLQRQGVTVEVEPVSPEEGLTGIPEVDAVVLALNPNRRTRPPVLLSPDLPERCDRVTVVPAGGS